MWQTLFDKSNEDLQKMNFSKQIIKKIIKMRKADAKIVSFIDKCEVKDSVDVAIRFSKVYGSLEAFVTKMEGKETKKRNVECAG